MFKYAIDGQTTLLDYSLNFVINGSSGSSIFPVVMTGSLLASPLPPSSPSPPPPPPPPPRLPTATVMNSPVYLATTSGSDQHGKDARKLSHDAGSFTLTAYTESMALTAIVRDNLNEVQSSGSLQAYAGGELRGIATSSIPPFGWYTGISLFQMTIGADAQGEALTFEYDHVVLTSTVPLNFVINDVIGSVFGPFLFTIPGASPSPTPPPPASASAPPPPFTLTAFAESTWH